MAMAEVCGVPGCERPGYCRVAGGVRPCPPHQWDLGPAGLGASPGGGAGDRRVGCSEDGATGVEVLCDRHLVRFAFAGRAPAPVVRLG